MPTPSRPGSSRFWPRAFRPRARHRLSAAGRALALALAFAAMHGPANAQSLTVGADPKPVPRAAEQLPPSTLKQDIKDDKAAVKGDGEPEQVRFEADRVQDQAADATHPDETVTASGNVVLRREEQTVRADAVTWNRRTGQIVATGNIRLVDEAGNVLYTEKVELTDKLKAGAMENMLLVLREGGRLAARHAVRDADGLVQLDNAAYTGCAIEDDNGCPKKPSWEITAVRVTYNPEDQHVRYHGAVFHLFGLGLLPLPGLVHTLDNRPENGLLVPDIKSSATNGLAFIDSYYFRFAENRDLTLGGYLYTNTLPMVSAKFRQLTDLGAFQITGYATQSRAISVAGTPTSGFNFRGYFDTNGRAQFNENWSIYSSIRLATDRTFLRRYDISYDDELRSTINLERVGPSSYFSLAAWGVQTLRPNENQGQVPLALPVLDYRKRIDPRFGAGGVLELEANLLGIRRSAGQDTQRAFAKAEWNLRTITGLGQVVTFTALARGDLYHSDANSLTSTAVYQGRAGWQTRGVASAAVDVIWPFVGAFAGGTQVITPHVQIVVSPTIANLKVPNEDSRAVDLEDSNLFALNRFPGYDRYEGGVRLTYGFDYRLDRPGWRVTSTLGQSVRLSNQSNLLPDGTGLSSKVSDVVGRTTLRFKDLVEFTWRYRLDKDNLALRRSEFDATIGNHKTYAEVGYLSLNRNIDPAFELLQDRDELRLAGRVAIKKYYSVFASAIVNLTRNSQNPALNGDGFQVLRHRAGIAYSDDCIDLSFTWRRDYITTGDARKGNSFQINFALRNIGIR